MLFRSGASSANSSCNSRLRHFLHAALGALLLHGYLSGEPLYNMVLGFLRDRISLRFLCVEIIGIQNAELQEIIDERTSLSAYYHAENF